MRRWTSDSFTETSVEHSAPPANPGSGVGDEVDGDPRDWFVGREAEVEQVAGIVLNPAARPRSCLVSGPPGAGKTALIRQALRQVGTRPGAARQVLWCTGSEAGPVTTERIAAELILAWRDLLPDLPPRHRNALLAVLGDVDEVGADGEPGCDLGTAHGLAAAVRAVVELLDRAARPAPLVVVVDDLQRADPRSRALLLHVATELQTERVALVLGVRDPGGSKPTAAAGALRWAARDPAGRPDGRRARPAGCRVRLGGGEDRGGRPDRSDRGQPGRRPRVPALAESFGDLFRHVAGAAVGHPGGSAGRGRVRFPRWFTRGGRPDHGTGRKAEPEPGRACRTPRPGR